jgi:hypothetical protein
VTKGFSMSERATSVISFEPAQLPHWDAPGELLRSSLPSRVPLRPSTRAKATMLTMTYYRPLAVALNSAILSEALGP